MHIPVVRVLKNKQNKPTFDQNWRLIYTNFRIFFVGNNFEIEFVLLDQIEIQNKSEYWTITDLRDDCKSKYKDYKFYKFKIKSKDEPMRFGINNEKNPEDIRMFETKLKEFIQIFNNSFPLIEE